MKNLYMMCGASGSGKSTWIMNKIITEGGVWVSRDMIRMSMVKADEPYFSKEDNVLKEFYATINQELRNENHCENVFADATFLSPRARREFLRKIDKEKVNCLIAVSFDIPLETLLARNANRKGRANVPMTVIRDMYGRFIHPCLPEGFDKIIIVDKNNCEKTLDKLEEV